MPEKNSWQELDEHSKKLIAREKGLQAQKFILGAPYNIIKELMGHGYKPGTNDTVGVDNAVKISLMLMGTGGAMPKPTNILGMAGGRPPSWFTPEKLNQLKILEEQYRGVPGRNKQIIKDFRSANPDIPEHITDGRIIDVKNESRLLGGINKKTSAPGSEEIKEAGIPSPSLSRTMPRLNTESPGEAMNWLQAQKPVDESWIRNWAKEANVPIDHVTGGDTKYLKLKPQNPPSPGVNEHLVVRLPQDEERHIATNILPPRRNAIMDTGTSIIVPNKGTQSRPAKLNQVESSVVNESGMSYANPEAADAWLKYNTQQAPGGGNWLIPEEMKPRPYINPTHDIQGPKLPENWHKDQLKLLSGGYTPADILQILRQQNGQSQN